MAIKNKATFAAETMCKSKPKICHLTSVHPHYDTRIFVKECCSLAQAGYETHLIAPDAPEQIKNGVHLHGLQKIAKSRLSRMVRTTWSVYRKARLIDADSYHFHDPELIPIGLLLKLQGKRVIYDVHEDVPAQIMTKHWIPRWLRAGIAQLINLLEFIGAQAFDGIITVTPAITRRFPQSKTVTIQNFPILSEFVVPDPVPYDHRPQWVVYIGAITQVRGIQEMVQAMDQLSNNLDAQLILAGVFASTAIEEEVRKLQGWEKVRFLSWQPRDSIAKLLAQARVGLVVFHPVPNHTEAQPNKLFEYMSASIPVIVSNFSKWRDIIEPTGCGLAVDPLDTHAIARAIEFVLTQPKAAEAMGRRGREAVEQQYNWDKEAAKLVQFYSRLFDPATL